MRNYFFACLSTELRPSKGQIDNHNFKFHGRVTESHGGTIACFGVKTLKLAEPQNCRKWEHVLEVSEQM